MIMEAYKREFIKFMLEAEVLTFGDFVTKSGRKTPYFINTGNYRTGKQIARLGEFYAACIMEHIAKGEITKDITAFFGPAYKGIPIVVAASIAYSAYGKEVGYCFNRKEAKDHGEGGLLVGHQPKELDKILILEDVITAGTAIRETLPILRSQGNPSIEGLVISVDRMERGKGAKTATREVAEEFGIRSFSIVTVEELLPEIPEEQRVKMEAYMDQYCVV